MSPPPFSTNVINVYSTGQMQIICFLFVNTEIFSPLQHGQLQLFYFCKFTSRIDSQRLLLDEEILSCFLPCVNEIRSGPDLQYPVVTIASYSNYVETITLILSVHFRSMFNKHCTGFTILNTKHTDHSLSFRLELIPPRGGVSHADPPSPLVSIISVFFQKFLVPNKSHVRAIKAYIKPSPL